VSNINLPEYSQPVCTVLQIAIVDLLKNVDLIPFYVVGHSSGEVAAAYVNHAILDLV
jgi:malonyl CoA-acyl carrier protein transacylase